MEFLGFTNGDFDFFKKKSSMSKSELDDRKEEIKRHFREFCYQIQKCYHSTTGGTLILDKDFQGLSKNKNYICAVSISQDADLFALNIILTQDYININVSCPQDNDSMKFEQFKDIIESRADMLGRFFKENKVMFLTLYNKNYKKQGEDTWVETCKFSNNEMCYGDYKLLLENMEKVQPAGIEQKTFGGIRIAAQYSKADVSKIGKNLPARACADIIKLLSLSSIIK